MHDAREYYDSIIKVSQHNISEESVVRMYTTCVAHYTMRSVSNRLVYTMCRAQLAEQTMASAISGIGQVATRVKIAQVVAEGDLLEAASVHV